MAKKKFQQGDVIPINWEHNPKAQYDFLDDKLNKEITKRKAGSHSTISRQDYDKFKQGTLPNDHPLMNLVGGHRKRIISEFEKSPELSHLRTGEINLSLIPKSIVNGKQQDGSLGSGSAFDILSRAYNKTTVKENNDYLPINPEPVKLATSKKKVLQPGEYPVFQRKKNMKAENIPYGNVLGRAMGLQQGGIIEDDMGQWNHPGKVTKINSNKITMKGVNYPVLGVSDSGDKKMMMPNKNYKFKGKKVTEYPLAQDGINDPSMMGQGNPYDVTPTGAFDVRTGAITPETQSLIQPPQKLGIGEKLGGAQGILNIGEKLIGGIQQIKQEKENKKIAEQSFKLSRLVNKASSLPIDGPERKYVRPEDQIIDQETLTNTYGSGTNYLKQGGNIPKAQWGKIAPFFQQLDANRTGNLGQMLGSAIGGGKGVPNGGGSVGSTIGETVGSLVPIPGVKEGLSFVGGAIGAAFGAKNQKQTAEYEKGTQKYLAATAFQQGSKQIQNQYTGFMQNGGQMNGDLQTYNGEAEPVSQNPYLPDGGESVLFRGASHDNGGIDIKFGNSPVEVEGGEPAVKLENGLTVFGDMNIPSYGALELNDPKAKGKKFKSYINDLNKKESKQNDITDESMLSINSNPMATSFDKLKMSSNEAMLKGANMNLQEIAQKKQIASNVQKAILDTADEFNLDSSELAKGNIKKMKKGKMTAQAGINELAPVSDFPLRVDKANTKELQRLYDLGFKPVENDANRLYRTTSTGGTETIKESKPYRAGSLQFQKEYAAAEKAGLKKFIFSGDKQLKAVERYGQRTTRNTSPGSSKTDFVDLYDVNKRPLPSLTEIQPINPQKIPSPYQTPQQEQRGNFDWMGAANSVLPYLRPSNQRPLDGNQLHGEMFSLATNNLEPVQAQLYNPLLEQVSDISLQDQLNENTSDFRSIQRSVGNNPEALAALAAQKYQANSGVLGEQFRLNQGQRQGTYNRNRATLNDAQLKNLAILDQQYVRQSTAKSNTKAVAKSALDSISNKIQQNKLENRTLGIYENLYNYRFGPKGYAYNMNPLFNPNIPQVGEDLPLYNEGDGSMTVDEYRQKYDKNNIPAGSEKRTKTTKKNQNGGIVKALKGY